MTEHRPHNDIELDLRAALAVRKTYHRLRNSPDDMVKTAAKRNEEQIWELVVELRAANAAEKVVR